MFLSLILFCFVFFQETNITAPVFTINTESGTMDSIVRCGEQLTLNTAVEWKHPDIVVRGHKTEKHLEPQILRK